MSATFNMIKFAVLELGLKIMKHAGASCVPCKKHKVKHKHNLESDKERLKNIGVKLLAHDRLVEEIALARKHA